MCSAVCWGQMNKQVWSCWENWNTANLFCSIWDGKTPPGVCSRLTKRKKGNSQPSITGGGREDKDKYRRQVSGPKLGIMSLSRPRWAIQSSHIHHLFTQFGLQNSPSSSASTPPRNGFNGLSVTVCSPQSLIRPKEKQTVCHN